MPKVSIVLPTYNGEKYLRESVDSVIKQTFTDWELIIVNDCSIDSTPQIAEEYAKNDSRIRVLHNKTNQKLPSSLNIGFREAKGDFLTWTSDDNLYLPTAIEKLYSYLMSNDDIYMVCSNMNLIDSDGDIIGPNIPYDPIEIYMNNSVGASFMYRRDVLDEVGEYDTSKFLVEDHDYWLRILFKYGKIGYIGENLYLYRTHPDSLTTTRKKDVIKQILNLRKYYIDNILHCYKDSKEYTCALYYGFKRYGFDVADLKDTFFSLIPELENEKELDLSKPTIVVGAGKIGDKVYELLKGNVKYYADSDSEKIGSYKNNIEIISIDEVFNKKDDYNILIAITEKKVYEILEILHQNGIYEFTTFQSIIKNEM